MTVTDLVERAKHFHHIVITGGEPILQLDDVKELIRKIQHINPDTVFEIETNGTLIPVGLKNIINILFNVSIKLTNNGNNTYEQRIKPEVIRWHVNRQSRFKFVVNTTNDIDEVNLLVNKFGIKKENIWLMPLGATREEQLDRMLKVIIWAKAMGVNFSPRIHTLIWNNKRGV